MYFNHSLQAVEARGANERGNRESYANELQSLVRDRPSKDDEVQEITDSNTETASPKSFFDDNSDDKCTRQGRKMKVPLSSLKVSTTNFFARSRGQSGGLGRGSQAFGSSTALGISGVEQGVTVAEVQKKSSPVIGTPTHFRRLNSAQGV